MAVGAWGDGERAGAGRREGSYCSESTGMPRALKCGFASNKALRVS